MVKFFLLVLFIFFLILGAFLIFENINPPELKNTLPFNLSELKITEPFLKSLEQKLDLPVLTYHYIRVVQNPTLDQLGFSLSVTPENFKSQMQYLIDYGYTTISPDFLYQSLKKGQKLPGKSVILTFDDGYQDFYQNAFPILSEFNLKATIFVVVNFVGDKESRYLSWDQIKEMDQSGLITFGSHTLNHANVTTVKDAYREVFISKRILERKLGHSVTVFAYPGGVYNQQAVNLVQKAGYNLAFTTKVATEMRYSQRFYLPRVRISGGLPLSKFPEKLQPISAK